ncbi:hypothetical protein EPN18_04540 [bacterium]|nr:MAG: hypothetical protein EPN18_04540 [bacterium]
MKKYLALLTIVPLILIISAPAYGKHPHKEKEYQKVWCDKAGGVMEYVVSGGSRVDCLTTTHAVEVEFAPKWQEAIGQALYYGKKTKRTPGIVLILESKVDNKYLGRLIYTLKKNYPFVRVWPIRAKDIKTDGVTPAEIEKEP